MVESSLQEESQGINSDWIIPGLIFIGIIVTVILIYSGDDDKGGIKLPTTP
jgi:hypothetical protein